MSKTIGERLSGGHPNSLGETVSVAEDVLKDLFEPFSPEEYLAFLADYEEHKSMQDSLKYELANL